MNRRRIAFVYWPGLAPDSARLETMPFAINVIKRLTAANWEVDVFLWERPLVDYREIFSNTVRVRYKYRQSSLPSRARANVVSFRVIAESW
jgi:hypothetical protein